MGAVNTKYIAAAGLLVVLTAFVASAQAGTITLNAITSDANCGISTSKLYLHKYDAGGFVSSVTALVNGVQFDDLDLPPPSGSGDVLYEFSSTEPNQGIAANKGDYDYRLGAAYAGSVAEDQGVYDLFHDCFWHQGYHGYSRAKVTLKGFTPGVEYDTRLYSRPQYQTAIPITFDVNKDGAAENTTALLSQGDARINTSFTEQWQTYSVSYRFTAVTDELWMTFDADENSDHKTSWVHTGFTTEVVSIQGDANLDGVVNDSDLNLLLTGWGTGTTWQEGDFNIDLLVNDSDLNLLLTNWNYPPASAGSPVPEPATIGLLAFGAIALVRRRRRA